MVLIPLALIIIGQAILLYLTVWRFAMRDLENNSVDVFQSKIESGAQGVLSELYFEASLLEEYSVRLGDAVLKIA